MNGPLANSCQNKFGLFCQFTWRKKSVGNAFYFSITKICEPYKKISFIFVFKIKYPLTNGQQTWNISKDWFFNHLIIQYEQNSYIHLWRGYVCTRKFTIKNRIWCNKKNFIFFYRNRTFVPLWSEFDVYRLLHIYLLASLKSSKLDKRLGSPTEITSSTLQTLKYTFECRNLVVICRNLPYIIGGNKGNKVFQTLIVLLTIFDIYLQH